MNQKTILENFTHKLPLSGVSTIIGPGGSGKSTLMKTLFNHFSGGDFGEYDVDGDISPHKMTCQYLPQSTRNYNTTLNPDNLTRLDLNIWGFSAKATDFIKRAITLSTEEMTREQRKIISMTLLANKNPSLLLLDEPVYGMSVDARNWICELLLQEKKKRTIFLITHNICFAKTVSDYVLFMMDGQILEAGYAPLIFESPQNEIVQSILEGGM